MAEEQIPSELGGTVDDWSTAYQYSDMGDPPTSDLPALPPVDDGSSDSIMGINPADPYGVNAQDYPDENAAFDWPNQGPADYPIDTSTQLVGPFDGAMDARAMAQYAGRWEWGGPSGFKYDSGNRSTIEDLLGLRGGARGRQYQDPTEGGPLFPGDGGGEMPMLPGSSCGGGPPSRKALILRKVCGQVGKRVSAKAIVRFMVKYGPAFTAGATGLPAQDLLYLFADEKMRPHRRRGPHLYTVVKRIRKGHRLEAMLSRYARKAGAHGYHGKSRKVTCMFCRRSPCSCRRKAHG
jgi:hypothetical protein